MTHSNEAQGGVSASNPHHTLEDRLRQSIALLMTLQDTLRSENDSYGEHQIENSICGIMELLAQANAAFDAIPWKSSLRQSDPNPATTRGPVKAMSLDQIDKLTELITKASGVIQCLSIEGQHRTVSEEIVDATLWAVEDFLNQLKAVVDGITFSYEGGAA